MKINIYQYSRQEYIIKWWNTNIIGINWRNYLCWVFIISFSFAFYSPHNWLSKFFYWYKWYTSFFLQHWSKYSLNWHSSLSKYILHSCSHQSCICNCDQSTLWSPNSHPTTVLPDSSSSKAKPFSFWEVKFNGFLRLAFRPWVVQS